MFFKNLTVLRLDDDYALTTDQLVTHLETAQFKPCGATERKSFGWAPPIEGGPLAHGVQRQALLKLRTEKRLLPASVINREARDKAKEIADKQGHAVGRKQMREIREAVELELLPRAFRDEAHTMVWIDPVNHWIAVDGCGARAEDAVEKLLKTVPDFPIRPLRTVTSPSAAMTGWLAAGEGPDGFSIDRDCELRESVEERATVKYSRHNLGEDDVRHHIEAGKQAVRLALTHNDRVSFVLTHAGEVKRLAFLDIVKESAAEGADSAEELFDAEFLLMAGELNALLSRLTTALGGEAE